MEIPDPHRAHLSRSRVVRAGWMVLGCVCVCVGAVGVVLPGLPTTPFLVLAAACFVRSSQRLYDRLLHHKTFGPLIRAYREDRSVPAKVKFLSIAMMWVFAGFALGPGLPDGQRAARVAVAAAAVVGTIYLMRLRTRPSRKPVECARKDEP